MPHPSRDKADFVDVVHAYIVAAVELVCVVGIVSILVVWAAILSNHHPTNHATITTEIVK